jgi:hypothetical protein
MAASLPWDIIRHILLFDPRFILRNNRTLFFIGRIPKEDERYLLLSKIPRIYQMSENQWTVLLSEPISKKRFVLGYRIQYNTQWEYLFYTFTYNSQLKMFDLV